jgi:hypothetical protein
MSSNLHGTFGGADWLQFLSAIKSRLSRLAVWVGAIAILALATPASAQTYQSVSASNGHCYALLASGGVQCCGRGDSGELGNGGTTNRSTQVAVTCIINGIAVSAGTANTHTLLAPGDAQWWGSGNNGAIGTGSTGDALTRQRIATTNRNPDIVADGAYTATGDSLLFTRIFTALTGTAVTLGALGVGAKHTSRSKLREYLTMVRKVLGSQLSRHIWKGNYDVL